MDDTRPIDDQTPRDREILLYYPPKWTGAWRKQMQAPSMWRVGYLGDTPRKPTHWAPLPAEPTVDE